MVRELICILALSGAILSSADASAGAVPRPWTPVKADDSRVSVWGRDYSFSSNGMPVSVRALGRELLAGPMRIVCRTDGGDAVTWKKGGCWLQEADTESATHCLWQESDVIALNGVVRTEFDGMSKVTLTAMTAPSAKGKKCSSVWLEIPMRPEIAKLYVFSPASWEKLNNVGGVKGPMSWPFRCAVWLGDEKAGLCWFCESDEKLAQVTNVVEVLPGTKETVFRVRLAEEAFISPRTWVFGLQATPVKPWSGLRAKNRVMHSPRMGIGITIKRPERWWTAQRAFPNGNMESLMDAAKANGVSTVAFHEDWIPIQNNPACRGDFKAIVDACHARGLKALVYQGYELSPIDPLWGDLHEKCLGVEESGRYVGYWYRQPAQRDYRVCYANEFAGKWLERAKAAYVKLGLDGFYLDGTIMPRACANGKHGCGWRDAKGKLHATYPFFAVRKMMRELYEFVDARGGTIDAHQSGYICPATLAFVHSYWDGEQLACSKQDIKRALNLEAFRAEFMGVNHGVPCEFLCYEVPGKWSYDDAMALTLLHNVLVRPCGFGSEARLKPYWDKLDAFGAADAEWIPYWENPLQTSPASVKASIYRRNGKHLAVVSNISPDASVMAEVKLPAGVRKVVDLSSGRDLPVRDGKVLVELAPFRLKMLEF